MSSGVHHTVLFYYRSAVVEMTTFTNGQTWLENVKADNKRKGHATEALKLATAYADSRDITLRLKACRYGKEPSPSDEQLVMIYQKHGFVVDSSYLNMQPIRMIRKPGGSR